MRGTFTIPPQRGWGITSTERVRVNSGHRFVVLAWHQGRWRIEYRTDDRKRAHQRGAHVGMRVLDTETGEVT